MTLSARSASFVTSLLTAGALLVVAGCESDTSGDSGALDMSPESVTVSVASNPTNIVFSVLGGSGDYTWQVDDAYLGTIVGAGGTAIYTSTTNTGQNFITVMDSESNIASATVLQL